MRFQYEPGLYSLSDFSGTTLAIRTTSTRGNGWGRSRVPTAA